MRPVVPFILVISAGAICHCTVVGAPLPQGWMGEADLASHEIRLAPAPAEALKYRPVMTRQYANAVFVLAHELGHLRLNTTDEQLAGAYGRRHYTGIARQLGVKHLRTLRGLCWMCDF